MKHFRAVLIFLLSAISIPAGAADPASAEVPGSLVQRANENRSLRLLDKAVARFSEAGDAALAEFNHSPEFIDDELYVYVLGKDGTLLASGGPSATLIGRNVTTMQDAAGRFFFREMLDTAAKAGSGRVEYRWVNPVGQRVEPKVALFRKVGERILAVGYYTPRATAEQAKGMLERAAAAAAENREAALAAFNAIDGGFIQDDLYVFAVDVASQRFLAHGATPGLVGSDGRELRDPKGKAVIVDMLNIAGRKGAGELEYVWRNPVTGKLESKRSFFRTVDGMLIGVGHYTR